MVTTEGHNIMNVIGKFKPEELQIIDVYGHGDDWVYEYFANLPDGLNNAPDYDGSTTGCSDAISILIERAELTNYQNAAKHMGFDIIEPDAPVSVGHFGDGNWEGVDLAEAPDGNLYWIDLR